MLRSCASCFPAGTAASFCPSVCLSVCLSCGCFLFLGSLWLSLWGSLFVFLCSLPALSLLSFCSLPLQSLLSSGAAAHQELPSLLSLWSVPALSLCPNSAANSAPPPLLLTLLSPLWCSPPLCVAGVAAVLEAKNGCLCFYPFSMPFSASLRRLW